MERKPGKTTKAKKQWKGEKRGGPAPARHIPWPEIFKHHISVVEGHLRMMEMIQKHTAEGTGNHTTITAIVKRCHEMLYQTKDSTRAFVPPKNQRETVPLGSSSLSMYPGYSPEDIEYGKASGEAGQAIGDMRKQGLKWEGPGNGAEYQVGQAHGAKRKMVFHNKEKPETSTSEDVVMASRVVDEALADKAATKETGGESKGFVIDLNPIPVSASTSKIKSSKKRALEDEVEGSSSKKSKNEEKEKEVVVETEDISAEVEANLKAKEERAKAREAKKRRRSSGGETEQAVKKPKKNNSKKEEIESGAEGSGDGKKKKRKKTKDFD